MAYQKVRKYMTTDKAIEGKGIIFEATGNKEGNLVEVIDPMANTDGRQWICETVLVEITAQEYEMLLGLLMDPEGWSAGHQTAYNNVIKIFIDKRIEGGQK